MDHLVIDIVEKQCLIMKKTKKILLTSLGLFVICLSGSFLSIKAHAKQMQSPTGKTSRVYPPIGKRIYLIKSKANLAPSEIVPINQAEVEKNYMKDPKIPNFRTQRLVVRRLRKPEPKNMGIKPVVLNFSNVRIKGNFTQPRVSFKREYLDLKRADEPVKKDFFGRIYQVAEEEL